MDKLNESKKDTNKYLDKIKKTNWSQKTCSLKRLEIVTASH